MCRVERDLEDGEGVVKGALLGSLGQVLVSGAKEGGVARRRDLADVLGVTLSAREGRGGEERWLKRGVQFRFAMSNCGRQGGGGEIWRGDLAGGEMT